MAYKIVVLTCIIFTASCNVFGQFNLNWAKKIGSSNSEQIIGIANDEDGNIYACGLFHSTLDFDPGVGSFMLSSNGNTDIFLQKLDQNGELIFAFSFGGTSLDYVNDIKYANGFIYLTGYFADDTVDFDPGAGSFNLISNNYENMFVLKLDTAGNFIWANSYSGPNTFNDISSGMELFVDENSNVYITGQYRGTIDFDAGPSDYFHTSDAFYENSFALKLNSNGETEFAKSFLSTSGSSGLGITLDSANCIYVVGEFSDTCDFDPSLGIMELIASGFSDGFICKLSPNGNFIRAQAISGAGQTTTNYITINDNHEIICTGSFTQTVDLDLGPGNFNLISEGGNDAFISKYDTSGNFIDAISFGGTDGETGKKIISNEQGSIFISGYMGRSTSDTIKINPGSINWPMNSFGYFDGFIAEFSDDLQLTRGMHVGGTSSDILNDFVLKNNDTIIGCGGFMTTADFNPWPEVYPLVSSGSLDAYIFKMNLTCENFSENVFAVCHEYIVPSGDEIHFNSGTYKDTLLNSDGCDSILYLDLTIQQINNSVTQNDIVLTADETGATYQWLDCDDAMNVVPGAIFQSFTPNLNGNYAVEISKNNCLDTSLCSLVNTIGWVENIESSLTIYPNPVNDFLYLDFNHSGKNVFSISLVDITGREMTEVHFPLGNGHIRTKLYMEYFAPGIYFLQINSKDEKKTSVKIIKN